MAKNELAPGDVDVRNELMEPADVRRDERPYAGEVNDEVLRRPVRSPFTGFGLCVAIILAIAFMIRVLRLDAYMLGASEGRWAGTGWSFYTGSPLPGSMDTPVVSPLFQVANSISFFLFGATDATARLAPALFGFGMVVLVFSLRPFLTRSHLAATATLVAISPTLVFASRTVDPAIAVAFFSLLTLVALLRAGVAVSDVTRAGWSLMAGLGLAGMLASGVDGVTSLIALVAGIIAAAMSDSSGSGERPRGAVRAGVTAIGASVANVVLLVMGFAIAVVVLFSRLLTDFAAMSGLWETFADWGTMMMSRATAIPSSFYLWALLLYEALAVVFAVVAILSRRPAFLGPGPGRGALNPTVFAVWFLAALLLHSFASGRETTQAVLVALPVVLLGGIGLGDVFARIDRSGFWSSRSWGMPVMVLGLASWVVVVVSILVRGMDPGVSATEQFPWWLTAMMVTAIALVTIGAIAALVHASDRTPPVRFADPILAFVAVGLGVFAAISTAGLAYERADEGTELLARHIPTDDAEALIERINQVSRDLSVEDRTNIDPTGRYGLRIAIDPDVAWPYAWYFREYPFLRVTPPAGWNEDLDVAIAPTADGMETYGLTPSETVESIRPPQTYLDLDAGSILGRLFNPERWDEAIRYLVNREIENRQEPMAITVGYSNRVSTQLNPNFGPFDLFDGEDPGQGSGQGQLNQPAGIGVSPDNEIIYVLNAGNQRVDRYERDGTFIGVWDGAVDPVLSLSWNVNQGGTGLTVGGDGLVYIADTWNHIVLVVAEDGTVVRQLGQRGVLTDITDDGVPSDSPGLFFGPRGVAVTNERIFVTDTGNERVQVFSMDGTFLHAFGGFGSEAGQFVEPTGIAIGPDGNVWVADSGNGRIQVFTIEGEFLEEIAVPSWQGQLGVERLNALAFGPDGALYLTAPAAGLVEAYNGEEFVAVPNVPSVRAGGLAVTPEGRLLITDTENAVVLDIAPELPSGFMPDEDSATPFASPQATPADG